MGKEEHRPESKASFTIGEREEPVQRTSGRRVGACPSILHKSSTPVEAGKVEETVDPRVEKTRIRRNGSPATGDLTSWFIAGHCAVEEPGNFADTNGAHSDR
jgi:hypothetical protein